MVNQKYIQKLIQGHSAFILRAEESERYYTNDNDIKKTGASIYKNKTEDETNPLKRADNRISHNWHEILVDQKVGYAFTYPPMFDVGNDSDNKRISEILGDKFPVVVKNLGVSASNCGVGWLHYWNGDNAFQYAPVDPKQIVPVFSNDLEEKLIGVLRAYTYVNDAGELKHRCEYWDDTTVKFFEEDSDGLYVPFSYPDVGEEMNHGCGEVPFIMFKNNAKRLPDLKKYKDQIDTYDKIYSGFINDIDDVQEIIFILKNYSGTDKGEFIRELNLEKLIKVDEDGGVDTIRAEIPYEARNIVLEMTRKKIFTCGMGVDPEAEKIGNASGVALEFLYGLLELKTGMMETEFRVGFSQLVKAICRMCGMSEPKRIVQTWTRNKIRNDLENAQIAAQSKGIISDDSILRNHPWVDDVEVEKKDLEEEANKKAEQSKKLFGMEGNRPPVMEDEE